MRPLLEINLGHIQENYRYCQFLNPNASCGAVVKANAYGLGSIPIAKALNQVGCSDFFVSYIEEAIELIPHLSKSCFFYILHGIDQIQIEDYHSSQIIPILNHRQDFTFWNRQARGPAWLQFDTGMARLGFKNDPETFAWIKAQQRTFALQGFISHYACADEEGNIRNRCQEQDFLKLKKAFSSLKTSMDASAMILQNSNYESDLLRPGLMLYGGNPLSNPMPSIKPVITLKAKILQIETRTKGTEIGYGGTYQTGREGMRVATLSLGYADGISRVLSNQISFSHQGYKLPLLGRISMDLISIDISEIPETLLKNESYIEILGEAYTINDMAKDANTIPYEIITSLGNRFKRSYQ